MKRKQLAAIMLSAIMAVSACVPVNGISAAAAENTGAESTEASPVVEVLNEAVESVTEAEDSNEQGEAEEVLEAPAAQEMADAPDMQGESAEAAKAPAEEKAAEEAPAAGAATEEKLATAEAAAEEEPAAAGAATEEEPAAGAATEEEPATVEENTAAAASAATAVAAEPADEAATAEDRPDQVVEEETREEAGRPALRALQPDDFEDAEEIYSGDKKNEEAFRNNGYAVWKFTPDESGSYRFEVQTGELTYIVFYDADYNEIAYDGGYWLGIERYFREGVTYYLAAGLQDPDLAEDPDLYALICLDRLDMPDFYVEGEYGFQIQVPYGKEAALSLYAQSSTGEIYYKWTDESGKIVGTSDSYTFTPESNTTIYCTVSDGPDEETAHSEERQFYVSIENHLTVKADGEYEIDYGDGISSVDFGDPVTLKVTASADDDSGLTYRWERKEVSMVEDEDGELVSWTKYVTIEGEETDTYEIESAEESGRYCCTVTDRFGNGRALYFDLRVANLVSAYPEGAKKGDDTVYLHAESGSALTLRVIVNAADTSKVTFEWYRVEKEDDDSWSDWNLIPGADTSEYEIKSVKDGERYYCYVSDGNKEFGLDF